MRFDPRNQRKCVILLTDPFVMVVHSLRGKHYQQTEWSVISCKFLDNGFWTSFCLNNTEYTPFMLRPWCNGQWGRNLWSFCSFMFPLCQSFALDRPWKQVVVFGIAVKMGAKNVHWYAQERKTKILNHQIWEWNGASRKFYFRLFTKRFSTPKTGRKENCK